MQKQPKIGLALSSGAVRGFSQVGVLKELEKAGIKIDMISGSSAGAMIASAFAVGRSVEELEKISLSIPWDRVFDFHLSSKSIISGKYWKKFIEIITMGKSFKEVKIPLFITTTNLTKEKRQMFTSGNLQKAVLASASIPGIVPPVEIDGDEFVDGGVLDPIPFQVLQEAGCDVVIAVDLSEKISHHQTGSEMMKKASGFHKFERKIFHDDMKLLFEFIDKNRILPLKISRWANRLTQKFIEWFLTPARAIKRATGKPSMNILAIMSDSVDIVQQELLAERIKHANNVIFIKPHLQSITKAQFWDTKIYIKKGELAARKEIRKIKLAIAKAAKVKVCA